MKKLIIYMLPLVMVALSCSSYRYHTTKMTGRDFSQFHTYGWLPPVDSLSKSYFDNDIAQNNIMETANRELEARGLTYTKDNPDLLFRYIAIVNNKSKPLYAPAYGFYPWGMWGYNPWMWGGWHMGWNQPAGKALYRAGHIIIEARERKTDAVIWQARGTGEVRTPEDAINKLPEVVAQVMAQYPVPPQTTSGR